MPRFARRSAVTRQRGASLHNAYVLATRDGLADVTLQMHHTSGLLVAAASSPEALKLWQDEYAGLGWLLATDTVAEPLSLLVQTACDSVWFATLLGHEARTAHDLSGGLSTLLSMLKTEVTDGILTA